MNKEEFVDMEMTMFDFCVASIEIVSHLQANGVNEDDIMKATEVHSATRALLMSLVNMVNEGIDPSHMLGMAVDGSIAVAKKRRGE